MADRAVGARQALVRMALAMLAIAVQAGCGSGEGDRRAWERPADPRPPEEAPAWPVSGDRLSYLDVRGQPGPALADGDRLAVPTGFGLRLLPRDGDGPDLEVATPGWSRGVVRAGETWWVADGARGLAVLREDGGLSWDRSVPLGTVTSVVAAGDRALATVAEGALVVLEPDPGGLPVEVARLTLDGTPTSVTVRPRGAGFEWLVAAAEAGLVRGRLDERGRPEWTSSLQGRWVTRAVFFGSGVLTGGASPELWGTGLPALDLPLPAGDLVVTRDGAAWVAVGARGLARLGDGDVVEPAWVRARAPTEARALATDPEGERLFVSWSDGLVEELSLDGEPVGQHVAGREGIVRAVAPGFVGLYLGRDRGRVLPPGGAPVFEIPAEIYDIEAVPGGALLAAEASGVARIARAGETWEIEEVRRSVADAVARGADGRIWIADEIEGLVELDPAGGERVHRVWSGAEPVTAAVNERWAVTTTFFASDLLAVDLAGGPPVRAALPGRATGLALDGDRAFVSMPFYGLAAVPLDRGDWPEIELLELPWPDGLRTAVVRACGGSGQVLVMLGRRGVAVVDTPADGPPALNRVVETPGEALDCAEGPDGSWLIADSAALIELTLR